LLTIYFSKGQKDQPLEWSQTEHYCSQIALFSEKLCQPIIVIP